MTGIEKERRRANRELIASAIRSAPGPCEKPAVSGTPFGDYVLERELGRGGFGIVYLARHAGIHRHVALKRMKDDELATDSEIEHFLQGAAAAAALDHPNIVPVFHVSGRSGPPFFTMRYVNGGNLAEALDRCRPTAEQALRWIAALARAVQHAHDRGVIHLDLKPANILLDETNTPYVTDFGLARRLDPATGGTQSNLDGGAPYYMAPEQLTGDPSGLTVRTDVYALGVMLHELLTGEVPYTNLELDEWKTALLSPQPTPNPLKLEPDLDPDLAAICAKASAKQPEHRYRSALALLEDLERLERGERDRLSFRARSTRARVTRWLREHRFQVGLLTWAVSLPTVFAVELRAAYRSEHEALARQQQEDAAMASVQAVAFRFQLLEHLHRVARLAQQPEIIALLQSPNVEDPSDILKARGRGFGSMFVMSPDGRQRARTTRMPEEYMQRSFAFRDYFRGAQKLALSQCAPTAQSPANDTPRTAYLARAHASESDGHFEFAMAAPVCDAHGWIGVLGATIESNKEFGSVRLSDGRPGRFAALLGPRDTERKDAGRPLPDGLTFIVHPGLTPGREHQLKPEQAAQVRGVLGLPVASGTLRYVEPFKVASYLDPVPVPGLSELWSAAFAPVDASGFVVVVQSPRRPAPSFAVLGAATALKLLAPFGVSLALLLAFRARRRTA